MVGSMRRLAAAVGGLVLAAGVAACGQDVVTEGSSNRGASSQSAQTSVENAYIVPRFVPGSCAIQVGDVAALRFTVTNNRTAESERLLAISTPVADSVTIEPAVTMPIGPDTTIAVGQPVEQLAQPPGPDRPFTATLQGIRDTAEPGKSVEMTFRFEDAGDLQMRVAVEACPTQS